MLKSILFFLSKKSSQIDQENILSLLEFNPSARLLDLGAGDGTWTKIIARRIGTKNITAVDISPHPAGAAEGGIIAGPALKFIKSDLNFKFPFPNNSFDVVSANQIIEHINNTESFLHELKRVLKNNGYAIISTENLSGWHNIFALILGWQPFSLNHHHPLSHLTVPIQPKYGHVKAFSYFGLKNLFKKHGFKIEKILPAGYFHLQSKLDPLHCHRITIKVRKQSPDY